MMHCRRCGGLMTYEKFYSSHDHYWGWRCISCGDILDQIILENRRVIEKRRELKAYRREASEPREDGTF